jgi:PmbA protein
MSVASIDALRWPASTDGDVFVETVQKRSLAWAEGKPSLHEESFGETMAVRVLEKGSEGIVSTRALPPPDFPALVEEARAMALLGPADINRRLSGPATGVTERFPIDGDLFKWPSDAVLDRFRDLERRTLGMDRRLKKIVKFQFSEGRSHTALRSTAGAAVDTDFSSTHFMAEILAEDQGETQVAWDSRSARFACNVDIEQTVADLAAHALGSLGAKTLPTGEYAVVLAPRVGVQLLELLSDALSADAVQMGRSFLAGKMGTSVGSPVLNIVDDPLMPDGIASAACDDEATPRRALPMLENGVLRNFFYDIRTGGRDGVPSNGRGHRGAPMSPPKPSATNLYVKPGSIKLEELLASDDRVFLVRDVMGLHMADRITGEFSLGAAGVLYKQGRAQHAVRGVTMAGSVADVLTRVKMLGGDFRWYGSVGCASLFVQSLSIAGA